jgi:predicted RNA-binding protein with RPS1 domain
MLGIGQIVSGTVTRREPFGVFVEIGEPELGVLLADAVIDGDPSSAAAALPEIGERVDAVFLGYGLPRGTQPRLSIRPSDLRRARGELSKTRESA